MWMFELELSRLSSTWWSHNTSPTQKVCLWRRLWRQFWWRRIISWWYINEADIDWHDNCISVCDIASAGEASFSSWHKNAWWRILRHDRDKYGIPRSLGCFWGTSLTSLSLKPIRWDVMRFHKSGYYENCAKWKFSLQTFAFSRRSFCVSRRAGE